LKLFSRFSHFSLLRALLQARREIKDLTMTRDELLQKIEGVKSEATALRAERDSLAAQVTQLQAAQDLSDVGAAVDGIGAALQPQPIQAAEPAANGAQ
jgi:chromosome segregation ATPase